MTPRTGQLELSLADDANVERSPEYAEAATTWIVAQLAGSRFTAETLRGYLGDPPGRGDVLGTICRNARKAGLVRAAGHTTSTRAKRHGAQLVIWERL